jgi:putative NADPH-quinone reductase
MTENRANDPRRCLLVSCHPLADSLCNHLVDRVKQGFAGHPIEVEHFDLYSSGFTAPLTAAERRGYFAGEFDAAALGAEIAALQRAEMLVLVFPTWWFAMPALLKGWFDRVWAPGVAFAHPAEPGGRIAAKLDSLRHCLVVTTLGSPWWFDRLIMWQPLKRIIEKALIGTCAPGARFDMLSLYNAMALEQPRLNRFLARIDDTVVKIAHSLPARARVPGRYPL